MNDDALAAALHCEDPAPERAGHLALYAFLIGRWTFEATVNRVGGEVFRGTGSIHAGWVLDGRALQDVWILPGSFHGTTLRVYDAGLDAWHIAWTDPLQPYYSRQVGRACGADIVQLGRDDSGRTTRWRFTERTPDAFHWTGEYVSPEDGEWRLEADFRARRASG